MRQALRIAATFAALLFIAACSDKSTEPDDDDENPNQTVIAGSVNGAPWTGTIALAARSGNTVSVSGRDAQNREVQITIAGATAAGSFEIGSTEAPATVRYSTGNQVWAGHLAGATGAVVILTLTEGHMIGTFTVTLQPQTATGATGTVVLAGTFTAYFGQT